TELRRRDDLHATTAARQEQGDFRRGSGARATDGDGWTDYSPLAASDHTAPGNVSTQARSPMRLYIWTSVNGRPRMPSWTAHERPEMVRHATGIRNGLSPVSRA